MERIGGGEMDQIEKFNIGPGSLFSCLSSGHTIKEDPPAITET